MAKEPCETHPICTECIDVFTDGSEIKNKKYQTLGLGWAYIIKRNKVWFHEQSGSITEGTNQRVELLAIYNALMYLTHENIQSSDITVYTDSEYSLKCITVWSTTWKRNGWKKTGTAYSVKHRDIIEPCMQMYVTLQQNNEIRFQHVHSHIYPNGYIGTMDYPSEGNSEVDKLATTVSRSIVKLNMCTSYKNTRCHAL